MTVKRRGLGMGLSDLLGAPELPSQSIDESTDKVELIKYIKNEINGVMYIFGVFDNPLDAIAARLDCMKNQWELVSISEEEYFALISSTIFSFEFLSKFLIRIFIWHLKLANIWN